MKSSLITIIASIAEFEDNDTVDDKIDASTSVNSLKNHFFKTLDKIGSLLFWDLDKERNKAIEICQQENVVFASFHEMPPYWLPCRLLYHTKGALMLTGGFMCGWVNLSSTMNLVTAKKQKSLLKKRLGDAIPNLAVFHPPIEQSIFHPVSANSKKALREKHTISKESFHIVYAGRLIANKGLAQLVRATNRIHKHKIRITLIGDFEPDFFIYGSNANHTTFDTYFKREIIAKSRHEIVVLPSKTKEELNSFYATADCLVYPSFHEDENFGLVPREAMLTGLPAIVSDFCGLGELPEGLKVSTFPTLGGVRYSIDELSKKIKALIKQGENIKSSDYVDFVENTYISQCSTDQLKNAVECLVKEKPNKPKEEKWRSERRVDYWKNYGTKEMRKAIDLKKSDFLEGLYVNGTGDHGLGWFSEPHFFKAIQSLYTTKKNTIRANKNTSYSGFWRIGLLNEEKAIIEYGFPGPRLKYFNDEKWTSLISCQLYDENEIIFKPKSTNQLQLVDELIELGYLVPN